MDVFEAIDLKLKDTTSDVHSLPTTSTATAVHIIPATPAEITPVKPPSQIIPVSFLCLDPFTKRSAVTCTALHDFTEETKCVLRGKVSTIVLKDGWLSFSCTTCKKMAGPKYGHQDVKAGFECDQCGVVTDVSLRIRTTVKVEDENGSCTLILFDSQLATMLKKSTEWLQQLADLSVDPHSPPDEIYDIIDKYFVFCVRVTDCNIRLKYPGYSVLNVTGSQEVFEAIGERLKSKFIVNMADDITPTKEPIESNTPSTTGLAKRKNDPGSDAIVDTPTGGTSAGIASLKIPRMDSL